MRDDITWTIEPADVEWEMDWTPREQYPDKPAKEVIFEHEGALAHLLVNGVCGLNNYWYELDWPDDAKNCINVFVIVNDTFAYACADAERLPFDQIETLYRMWRANPMWGATAWAVMRRKERPIAPVECSLRASGYDVDSWGLGENVTNAQTQAAFAQAAAMKRPGGGS